MADYCTRFPDDPKLVVIEVPQGLEKPYVCKGRIMVRRGAAVVPAVASEISSLIGQRAPSEARWERLPALGLEEDDLDADLIRTVAETIKERRGYAIEPSRKPAKVLERLGLVQAGQFSNAALVQFVNNPAEWYPQTRARAARFRDNDRTDFIDNKVVEGSLFSLVESLVAFAQSHIPVASSFDRDDVQRRDRLAYPLPAVHEAIVIALVHRDYSAFDGGWATSSNKLGVEMDRCPWAKTDLYVHYHDTEWGVPVHDDRLLFEFLILEGAQAGLSWETILNKRESYRAAFDHFDPATVAKYGQKKRKNLLLDAGIVRNRLKIEAAIQNAQMFLAVQQEFGTFDEYIWGFVGSVPKQNAWKSIKEVPAKTPESDAMSKDLKRRGFKFVGSTICYAYMQAVGMVNDHVVECFRHSQLSRAARQLQ